MKIKNQIMDENEIENTLKRIAMEIIEHNKNLENVVLIGIRSRGVPMAKRLKKIIEKTEKTNIPTGILDITLYRDDLSQISEKPIHKNTEINFTIDNAVVVLVDDVLYTGRTIYAALSAIFALGHPQKIQLCVLIDRGHHEIPIQADFVGKIVPTASNEIIKVAFSETDKEESVKILMK